MPTKNRPSRRSFDEKAGEYPARAHAGLVVLPAAMALLYLSAFTLLYWLPHHYLAVGDELFQFAAREPWRGVLFYAALAALFALYLAAYRHVARQGEGRPRAALITGLWAALFCLLLIPLQPVTSSDLYGYVFQGRIVSFLGENPFVHLYQDFSSDPFYFLVTFHHLPASTGYGPLWIAVAAALGWLAGEQLLLNLFLLKTLAAALHLASAFLVYAILGHLESRRRVAGMLLYAWNPVLLYELVGNGHNDALLVFLALCGFFLLSRDRGLLAIPCLAAAALVKPVAVLWLPLAALWLLASTPRGAARLRRALATGALALLTAAVACAPFWEGTRTFQGLLAQSDIHGNSLPSLLVHAGRTIWPWMGSAVVQGVKLLTAVLLVPFYLWQLRLAWDAGREGALAGLVCASFDLILFYLFFVGFQFWPWYLAWLLVPAALLPQADAGLRRRLALALCLLAPLLYFPFGWSWARTHLPRWFTAFLAAFPLLSLPVWVAVRHWRLGRALKGR